MLERRVQVLDYRNAATTPRGGPSGPFSGEAVRALVLSLMAPVGFGLMVAACGWCDPSLSMDGEASLLMVSHPGYVGMLWLMMLAGIGLSFLVFRQAHHARDAALPGTRGLWLADLATLIAVLWMMLVIGPLVACVVEAIVQAGR